ncbi:MAG: DUF4124 domain-containing protein [Xanthomonadales bacterium]|nr:DUF4124 domain-containing protein [Xanthomonadales bacterium]
MYKGMIRTFVPLVFMLLPLAAAAEGEIYKIVDKDGNVTFTDQRPSSNAEPMELPPLSVIETDIPVPAETGEAPAGEAAEALPLTPRELRRKYRDFRITSPQQEETFWGTANTVSVTWGSSEPIVEDLTVFLFVDGEAQQVPANGSAQLVLDRGEHQVYAELRDSRNRRIVATEPVTFFVKQHSVGFNRPSVSPGQGGPGR